MYFNTSACSMIVLNNLNIRYVVLECIIDFFIFPMFKVTTDMMRCTKRKSRYTVFLYFKNCVWNELGYGKMSIHMKNRDEIHYYKNFMLLHSCLFIWLSFGNALTWHTYSIHLIGCPFHVIMCQTNRLIHHHSLCVET